MRDNPQRINEKDPHNPAARTTDIHACPTSHEPKALRWNISAYVGLRVWSLALFGKIWACEEIHLTFFCLHRA